MGSPDAARKALALGALGVVGFSMSLPATRAAVAVLDPWFVAFGRAAVAALPAAGYLAVTRSPRPTPGQLRSLLVVVAGVVVGFPLLTSLALRVQSASHAAVVIAVLPAATAVFAVVRGRERPRPAFWVAAGAGVVAVLAFVLSAGRSVGPVGTGDVLLLAAVALCAAGYAEGALLSRTLGGPRTISWALVVAVPLTAGVTVAVAAGPGVLHTPGAPQLGAWAGFAYVSLVSMFLAFFAWYAGLARGGIARVGQLQLAQPVLSLAWAALLLGERVGPATLVAALAVVACVVATQRTR